MLLFYREAAFLFPVSNLIGLGNLAVFGKKLPFVGGGNN